MSGARDVELDWEGCEVWIGRVRKGPLTGLE